MDILSRQVFRWQRQQTKSDLPDEIYFMITEHSQSKHRRVITNLARVSRVLDEQGEIRPYDDFKHDWSFVEALIGEPAHCFLCGKHPILEHCILVDRETEKRITVGNVCVESFMAISSDEKKSLKSQVKAHKANQKKIDFAMRYPNALSDLKRYEMMMLDDTELSRLYKTMVRRLMREGFPGAKTEKGWELFIETADHNLKIWNEAERVRIIEVQDRIREQDMREAAFLQEINKRRNTWNRQSREWLDLARSIKLNNWERSMVNRVATKIKVSGESALKDGYLAFFESIHIRHTMSQPDFKCENPLFEEVSRWLDLDLNDWSRSFCISILIRIVAGEDLTPKQESHLISLRKRLS